jgi:hypothetical protein
MEHNFSSHDVCKERGKKEPRRGGVTTNLAITFCFVLIDVIKI